MKMPPGEEPGMSSLRTKLARPVTWLRAGYPKNAPAHGYIPLIALMPASSADDTSADGADRRR